jgi:cytochrome P450
MVTTAAHPARIQPPEQELPTFRLLRAVVDNPVKAWPRAIYRERMFRSRVLRHDMIYVMAPDLVRRVLVDAAEDFEKGEMVRRGLGPVLGDGILTAEGSRWRWQRRTVASVFRHERIRGFLPAMIAAAERTRDRFRSHPPAAEIDIAREMMRTTFDIILSTVVGGRTGVDRDLIEQSINQYLASTSWMMALAMVGAPDWTPYPGARRARRARDHLHHAMDALIDDARRNPGDGGDLLSLLMNATDPETGTSMNEMDVRYNLLTFITAGHETMALALTWTFYLLSLHPQAEERLRREIAGMTGGGPIRPEHIEALAYARQVIQEAMRLYPPAALIVRVARRDLRIGDEEVRAGTTIFVPIYAIHRHEAYWRKPDEFDPSRFEADEIEARDRYTYLPFGAGARICIGQSFALLEATAVLATIIGACRLRLRPDYIPEPRLRVTLRPARGMPMRIAGVGDFAGARSVAPLQT